MVDMSKIRVGTQVRLRNGEICVVEKWSQDCNPDERWPFEVYFVGDNSFDYYSEQGFYSGPSEPCDIDIVEILSVREKTEDRLRMNKKNRVMHLTVGDSFCFFYDDDEREEYYHVIARLDDGVLAVSSGPNPLTPKYFENCQPIESERIIK